MRSFLLMLCLALPAVAAIPLPESGGCRVDSAPGTCAPELTLPPPAVKAPKRVASAEPRSCRSECADGTRCEANCARGHRAKCHCRPRGKPAAACTCQ